MGDMIDVAPDEVWVTMSDEGVPRDAFASEQLACAQVAGFEAGTRYDRVVRYVLHDKVQRQAQMAKLATDHAVVAAQVHAEAEVIGRVLDLLSVAAAGARGTPREAGAAAVLAAMREVLGADAREERDNG